ncbi:MAG TPA: hypothetical protein VFG49_08905 [Dyella sp.]|uniref:hypothetical protein n=1 Tax=Dyella sp. TaxID=1869338 RepID=UPI002D77D828|nr:hypothetical protein [Dyella sp.]HET6553643.1 hypothetical protein [Dyella sp.]
MSKATHSSFLIKFIYGLAILAAGLSAGCSATKKISPRYQEPTSGPRARIRVVGLTPRVYAAACPSGDAQPNGRLTDWGARHLGKRDLGIPKQFTLGDDDYAEVYVPAGGPITVTFGMTNRAARGAYVEYCANSRATFIPRDGYDYEVRQEVYGFCTTGVAEVTRSSQGVQLTPVMLMNNQCGAWHL